MLIICFYIKHLIILFDFTLNYVLDTSHVSRILSDQIYRDIIKNCVLIFLQPDSDYVSLIHRRSKKLRSKFFSWNTNGNAIVAETSFLTHPVHPSSWPVITVTRIAYLCSVRLPGSPGNLSSCSVINTFYRYGFLISTPPNLRFANVLFILFFLNRIVPCYLILLIF